MECARARASVHSPILWRHTDHTELQSTVRKYMHIIWNMDKPIKWEQLMNTIISWVQFVGLRQWPYWSIIGNKNWYDRAQAITRKRSVKWFCVASLSERRGECEAKNKFFRLISFSSVRVNHCRSNPSHTPKSLSTIIAYVGMFDWNKRKIVQSIFLPDQEID